MGICWTKINPSSALNAAFGGEVANTVVLRNSPKTLRTNQLDQNSKRKLTTRSSLKVLGDQTTTSGTTAAKTLKKFVDAGKSSTPVLSAVDRYLLSRPKDGSRSTLVLHPSEIIRKDWCYRASYFLLRGEEAAPEPGGRRGLKGSAAFDMGHAIHEKWQKRFQNMGVLYGFWACDSCPYSWWDLSPETCRVCNSPKVRFREVPVVDPDRNIKGHADGWLKGITDEPLLLEIKSMGPGTFMFEDLAAWEDAGKDYETAWKNMKAPFTKHNLQTQIYMKLLEKYPDAPQKAVFIYESKPNGEFKEFHIRKSDLGISDILDAAAMIVEAVKNGTPPECNVKGKQGCWKCEVYS
jgi:hypothetical protein